MEEVIITDGYNVRFGEILSEVTNDASQNLANAYVEKAIVNSEYGHDLDTEAVREKRQAIINDSEKTDVEKLEAQLNELIAARSEALNKGILTRDNYTSLSANIKKAEREFNKKKSTYEARQIKNGEEFKKYLVETARAQIVDLFSDPLAFYEDNNLSYPIKLSEVKVGNKSKIESTEITPKEEAESPLESVELEESIDEIEKVEVETTKTLESFKSIKVGVAERPKYNEDITLHTTNGLFVVLDGMGGEGPKGSAKLAASIAANVLLEKLDNLDDVETVKANIVSAFDEANNRVTTEAGGGATTATAVKLIEAEDSSIKAVWASVGDTRIYLFRDGKITQLSKDEGNERFVSNGLGIGNNYELNQIATVDLKIGDRLMLCSDGITGDYKHQALSESEMESAFSQPTAQGAADKFLEYSKKIDDKSVIVIEVGEGDKSGTVVELSNEISLESQPLKEQTQAANSELAHTHENLTRLQQLLSDFMTKLRPAPGKQPAEALELDVQSLSVQAKAALQKVAPTWFPRPESTGKIDKS